MAEITILKSILNDAIQIDINQDRIEILEKQNISSQYLKKVIITFKNSNIDILGVKYDEETIKHKYIDISNKNLNKGVDAIIFLKYEENVYIFLIELKSTERKLEEVSYKFLSSMNFLVYLNSIMKFHYPTESLENFKIQPVLCSLKRRLHKSMRAENKIDFKSNNHELATLKQKISFLDISKVNPNNFEIKLSDLIHNSRGKDFKTWPL